MLRLPSALFFLWASTLVLFSSSRPLARPGVKLLVRDQATTFNSSDFDVLLQGNQAFRNDVDPQLLRDLAEHGQEPPFLFIGCSDSRVSEGTVFNAQPGTLFTERNIANRFSPDDLNVRSAVAYGVEDLHVRHIIVMGHYGCGGVAASVASPPPLPWDSATTAVQQWIAPIRTVYQSSQREEVVALRRENQGKTNVPAPTLHNPGFRALVEENVKNTVQALASDSIVVESYLNTTGKSHPFWIHGWVYDIENGEVKDLGISVGPPAGHALLD